MKPGQRVAVLGVDGAEFLTGLAERVPEYSRGARIKDADLIFFSAEARADLSQLKSLAKWISRSGGIWVVYPKGQTHIREVDVINAGKSASLTDNKVCPLLRHPHRVAIRRPSFYAITEIATSAES